MKQNVLIVGLGQAGGNMAEEMHKKGYSVLAVNSAKNDLNSLELPNDFKFHLRGGKGTAKDRNLSKKLAKESASEILGKINKDFKEIEIIHIISSAGGGTGGGSISGIAPFLKDMTKKSVTVSLIFPSKEENFRIKNNAIATFIEIAKVQDRFGQIFILSNEYTEKFRLNKIHADLLDDLYNLESSDKRGTLDSQEIKELIDKSGICIPCFIKNNEVFTVHGYKDIDQREKASHVTMSLINDYGPSILSSVERKRGAVISNVSYRSKKNQEDLGLDYVFYSGVNMNSSVIDYLEESLKEDAAELLEQGKEKTINAKVYNIDSLKSNLSINVEKEDIFKPERENYFENPTEDIKASDSSLDNYFDFDF